MTDTPPEPPQNPWWSRGYLPHFDDGQRTQNVTIHLADSLPASLVEKLGQQLQNLPPETFQLEKRKKIEEWMDASYGCCVLQKPDVTQMVQNSLLHFDGQRYRLFSWVIMPNHIHCLFQPLAGWTLRNILGSWKKFIATQITRMVPDTPRPVWHDEYFDRFIRNEEHFNKALNYNHDNPVKAGPCYTPEAWPWSSAFPGNTDLRIGTAVGKE